MTVIGKAIIEMEPQLSPDFEWKIQELIEEALSKSVRHGLVSSQYDLPGLRVRRYGWRYWIAQIPDVDGRWGSYAEGKSKRQVVKRMIRTVRQQKMVV